MSISGDWKLNYSWGCKEEYSYVILRFKDDGTWQNMSIGGKLGTGTWALSDGKIDIKQKDGYFEYVGDVVRENIMQGTMSTPEGQSGCWYALPSHSTTKPVAERPQEYNLAGRRSTTCRYRLYIQLANLGQIDAQGNLSVLATATVCSGDIYGFMARDWQGNVLDVRPGHEYLAPWAEGGLSEVTEQRTFTVSPAHSGPGSGIIVYLYSRTSPWQHAQAAVSLESF